MYFKAIGIVLLLLSALLGALHVISKEKKRIELLRGFSELFGEIYRQIEMLDLPLDKILSGTSEKLISLCNISKEEKITPETLIYAANELLDAKASSLISDFVSTLGKSYREEQLRLCKYYTAELGDLLSERERDYPKKKKLVLTLALCLALGLIIILI